MVRKCTGQEDRKTETNADEKKLAGHSDGEIDVDSRLLTAALSLLPPLVLVCDGSSEGCVLDDPQRRKKNWSLWLTISSLAKCHGLNWFDRKYTKLNYVFVNVFDLQRDLQLVSRGDRALR